MNTKNKNILKIGGILILGFLIGWLVFGGNNTARLVEDEHAHTEAEENQIWTCSMHPQIRQNEPGDCPICGMDLIPLEVEGTGANPQAVQMSEYAMKLANVQTVEAGERNIASNGIRLNGKVVVDERLAYSQSTHVPGRIEQLFVNFTGEEVNRGQALARIYSPEMVTAQEELLQAYAIKESNPRLFEAAKQKLRNWKIGESQINRILETGQASEQFTITSDVNGIVTEKLVELGDYVDRGMPIYEIADLSRVWVLFDIYESDMSWIEEGDTVEFTVASIPGGTFEGEVDFIDPILDPQTRVSTARVVVNNEEGNLKPGMFVTGIIENPIDENASDKITVPKSAVLWTGKRSVVYVKQNTGTFELREVVLGPSLGDSYVITEGLRAGEEVVVNGTFSVDAAAQLAGKPSMMNPDGSPSMNVHNRGNTPQPGSSAPSEIKQITISDGAKNAIKPLVYEYLELKNALVKDDLAETKKSAETFRDKLSTVNMSLFTGESHNVWMKYNSRLEQSIKQLRDAGNIEEARDNFLALSEAIIGLVETFHPTDENLYIQHCPMANSDNGADWLSRTKEIRNPYFGEAMLTCGEVTKEIE